MRHALLLSLMLATQVPVPQQPVNQGANPPAPTALPRGTGVLMGQVVDSNGAGVSDAVVTLQGGFETLGLSTLTVQLPGGPRSTITNATGQFAFIGLPKGAYSIEATKNAFLPGAIGRRRPSGQAQSITLGDGERNTQIRIPMWEYVSITGTARDETGEPIVGVQVRAFRRTIVSSRPQWVSAGTTTTNDLGEYRLDTLPPAAYVVAIVSTQTTLPLSVVDQLAASGGGNSEITMQLLRAGLPSGAVSLGATRTVGDWAWHSGSRTALVVPSPGDDGRVLVYPTTFYPGARSVREADVLTVAAGTERANVDFQLQLVAGTLVAGTASGPSGILAGLTIRLVPEHADELPDLRGLETALTVSDSLGRFAFVGVPTGRYIVQAAATPNSAVAAPQNREGFAGYWINQPVSVSEAGLADFALTLQSGFKVTGRLEFDGKLPKPPPEVIEKLMIRLEPIDPNPDRSASSYMTNFDRTGQFTIPQVPPGRYYVIYLAYAEDRRQMPGWETKGATHEGRDVSGRPLVVASDTRDVVMTQTDHATVMSGSVRNSDNRADGSAAVLMFSAERELWSLSGGSNRRFRIVRASETGAYSIRNLPSGEYFLIAIPDEQSEDWLQPQVLEVLAKSAMRVLVADGDKKTQDLIMRTVR